jgi:hypothetical protein
MKECGITNLLVFLFDAFGISLFAPLGFGAKPQRNHSKHLSLFLGYLLISYEIFFLDNNDTIVFTITLKMSRFEIDIF